MGFIQWCSDYSIARTDLGILGQGGWRVNQGGWKISAAHSALLRGTSIAKIEVPARPFQVVCYSFIHSKSILMAGHGPAEIFLIFYDKSSILA